MSLDKNKIKRMRISPSSSMKKENRHAKQEKNREAPLCTCKGSVTLEASVVIPVICISFLSILMFFYIMRTEYVVQHALNVATRKASVSCSSGVQNLENATVITLARGQFLKNKEQLQYVQGGHLGIITTSECSENYIEIAARYRIKIPFGLFGKRSYAITQRAVSRKWNGRKNRKKPEEEWVYITDYGSVYHTFADCRSIEIQVYAVKRGDITLNAKGSGVNYHICERCARYDKGQEIVYLTTGGAHYHVDRECSAINRNVHSVRKSEIGGRPLCKYCRARQ